MKLRSWIALATFAVVSAAPVCLFAAGGGELYKVKCASCHGADGSANTTVGKALKLRALGSPEVQKQSDAELAGVTAKGKGKMPSYETKLSKQELKDVVAFMRTLKK